MLSDSDPEHKDKPRDREKKELSKDDWRIRFAFDFEDPEPTEMTHLLKEQQESYTLPAYRGSSSDPRVKNKFGNEFYSKERKSERQVSKKKQNASLTRRGISDALF